MRSKYCGRGVGGGSGRGGIKYLQTSLPVVVGFYPHLLSLVDGSGYEDDPVDEECYKYGDVEAVDRVRVEEGPLGELLVGG